MCWARTLAPAGATNARRVANASRRASDDVVRERPVRRELSLGMPQFAELTETNRESGRRTDARLH